MGRLRGRNEEFKNPRTPMICRQWGVNWEKTGGRAKLEKSEVEGEIVKNRDGGQNRIITNF